MQARPPPALTVSLPLPTCLCTSSFVLHHQGLLAPCHACKAHSHPPPPKKKNIPALTPFPCPALPCPALPCPALPCPALPCPALPCPALPCRRRRPHFKGGGDGADHAGRRD